MPQRDLPPPNRDPMVAADRTVSPPWLQWFAREATVQIEDDTTPSGTPRNGTLRLAADGSALFVRVGDAWFQVALIPV